MTSLSTPPPTLPSKPTFTSNLAPYPKPKRQFHRPRPSTLTPPATTQGPPKTNLKAVSKQGDKGTAPLTSKSNDGSATKTRDDPLDKLAGKQAAPQTHDAAGSLLSLPSQGSEPSCAPKVEKTSAGLSQSPTTRHETTSEESSMSSHDTIRPPHIRENQFHAYGIPAYPTRAIHEEICRKFVCPHSWCDRGSRCIYIHPLAKAVHWRKIQCFSQPQGSSSITSFHQKDSLEKGKGKAKEPEDDTALRASEEKRLASASPQSSKTDISSVQSDGWDSSGCWMAGSGPEAWGSGSSDHGSGDQLFSSPSDSSSQTSVDGLSDVDRNMPAPSRPRPSNTVCIIWKNKGSCRLGDACRFKHDPSQRLIESSSRVDDPPVQPVVTGTTVSPQPIRHPRPRTNERCHKWLRDQCTLGYDCKYIHEDLDYDDDPVDVPASKTGQSSHFTTKSSISSTAQGSSEYISYFQLHDHIRVQCSAGFDIHNIQTAFESSTLLLSNISSRVRPGQLRELLTSYGQIEDLRIPPTTILPSSIIVVTFSDSSAAQKAQDALNGKKMFNSSVTARIATNNHTKTVATALFKDTSVRISWEAPAKEAYAGYPDEEQALRAIQVSRGTPLLGHYMKAAIHEGMPVIDVVTVRFRGVAIEAEEKDMVRFGEPTDLMWTRPQYKTLDDATRYINAMLRKDGAVPEQFDILPPPYRQGGMIRAWATYASASEAKAAARRLDKRNPVCTGYTPIYAKHVQSLSYTFSQERFASIAPAVAALQESINGPSVTVQRRHIGPVHVRLSADEQKELAQLKLAFETILKGEIVRCDGKVAWDSYFSRFEGESFLRNLSYKYPSVHIKNSVERRTIYLYGFSRHRANVAACIVEKIRDLWSCQISEISLPGWILGAVATNEDISQLRQQHGADCVDVDYMRRVLRVRGDATLVRTMRDIVDQISQRLRTSVKDDGSVCPVCFDRPSPPLRLRCGHSWCRACLSHYLHAAIGQRSFPLKCFGKQGRCGTKIPIAAARELLSEDDFMALVNAAYLAYVHARPQEFHFCPTPDCAQVYRSTLGKGTLQCPSCLTGICTKCHSEAHDGFDCADRGQDELFGQWLKDHDVKNCPTCKVPIERSEGCNHITCTRCQTHVCWQCMQTFPGGEGIYGHMREVHGTFGLGPIIDV